MKDVFFSRLNQTFIFGGAGFYEDGIHLDHSFFYSGSHTHPVFCIAFNHPAMLAYWSHGNLASVWGFSSSAFPSELSEKETSTWRGRGAGGKFGLTGGVLILEWRMRRMGRGGSYDLSRPTFTALNGGKASWDPSSRGPIWHVRPHHNGRVTTSTSRSPTLADNSNNTWRNRRPSLRNEGCLAAIKARLQSPLEEASFSTSPRKISMSPN